MHPFRSLEKRLWQGPSSTAKLEPVSWTALSDLPGQSARKTETKTPKALLRKGEAACSALLCESAATKTYNKRIKIENNHGIIVVMMHVYHCISHRRMHLIVQ
jgi:hypothetical protein